jgi:fused signal recognition particle receptor
MGLFGLDKTKAGIFGKLVHAVAGKSTVDEEVLDSVETALVTSDVGIATTLEIVKRLEARVARDKYLGTDQLIRLLEEETLGLLAEASGDQKGVQGFDLPNRPHVILVVGVNGVGKTTSIGKLASRWKKDGKHVLVGAADTFRAAAVDQLVRWCERAGVPCVNKGMDADPAAVAFETVQRAVAEQADVVLVDTTGRLHNKVNLMNELSKIKRAVEKALPGAPHEVLLVLDASTGQNALEQAKQFSAATEVNGLILTKLDGSARGGVALALAHQMAMPVRFSGTGEKAEDLEVFDAQQFVRVLFEPLH